MSAISSAIPLPTPCPGLALGAPSRARRLPVLPPAAAFAGSALAFSALFLAAGAPTPLLVLFEQQWGFGSRMLTIAFAAYAAGLLVALLVAGSLSDHIGRRPVLIGSLVLELTAMLMFVLAPDIGWVIAARVVQGLATGAATSAFSAVLVELAPERHQRLGSVIGSVAPAGGLGLGALLTGAAVQFSTAANQLVFTTLAVIMAIGIAVAVLSPETVTTRPGALASLVPRVTVPRPARREFAAAIPTLVSSWMLAGLVMGLVPTILRSIFRLDSGLLTGATTFVVPGSAAVAGALMGAVHPRHTSLLGGAAVLLGGAILVAGVSAQLLPLLFLGGIIGGAGFGASFSGVLRTLAPLADSHRRAGLFAAVFLVAYLAFGIPAVIAGQLVAPLGLLPTVIGYGVVVVLLASVGVAIQARAASRPDDQPWATRSGSGSKYDSTSF